LLALLALDKVLMFRLEVGLYPWRSVLKLLSNVSSRRVTTGRVKYPSNEPLLGLKSEYVRGSVTKPVTVRMKYGKNWP